MQPETSPGGLLCDLWEWQAEVFKRRMNKLPQANARTGTRRSRRLILRVPVLIYELGTDKSFILDDTHAITVNRYGALVALSPNVSRGQKLLLTNKRTQESKECRVAYVGPIQLDKRLVGIEFTQPAPDFWNISFPASDARPIPE